MFRFSNRINLPKKYNMKHNYFKPLSEWVLLLSKVGALPRNKHHVCTSLHVTNSVSRVWPQQKNVKIGIIIHILHILMSASWLWSFFFVTWTKKNFRKGIIKVFLEFFFLFHFFWVVFVLGLFFYLRSTEGVKKQKKLLFNQVWTQNGGLQETFLDSSDFDAQTEASEKTTKHLPHHNLWFWKKNFVFFSSKERSRNESSSLEKKSFCLEFQSIMMQISASKCNKFDQIKIGSWEFQKKVLVSC